MIDALLEDLQRRGLKDADVAVLAGWPTAPEDGKIDLYMSLGLDIWVEVPEDEIIRREPVRGGTSEYVWIRRDLDLTGHRRPVNRPLETQTAKPGFFIDWLYQEESEDGGETHTSTHTRWPYCR